MPRKLKAGLQRRDLDPQAADLKLRSGWDFFKRLHVAGIVVTQEDGEETILDVEWLLSVWRERREIILQADRAHHGLFHRPWAFWHFDRGMEQPNHPAQADWLREHGQLTPDERRADEAKQLAMNGYAKEKSQ